MATLREIQYTRSLKHHTHAIGSGRASCQRRQTWGRAACSRLSCHRIPLCTTRLRPFVTAERAPPSFVTSSGHLATLIAVEATADLPARDGRVSTPLGPAPPASWPTSWESCRCSARGWGWPRGSSKLIPEAEVWHIGLFRDETTLRPTEYYNKFPASPRITVALVVDPMLATGGSAVRTCEILKTAGVPRLKLLSLIAAPEGIARMRQAMPDVQIHVGAVDEQLNDVGFIYPGLGDAGDRQFATGFDPSGELRRPPVIPFSSTMKTD